MENSGNKLRVSGVDMLLLQSDKHHYSHLFGMVIKSPTFEAYFYRFVPLMSLINLSLAFCLTTIYLSSLFSLIQ